MKSLPKIDCHTHLSYNLRNKCNFKDAFPETLLNQMTKNNIRYSLVYATYLNSGNDFSNEDVKNVVEKFGPSLIGVGSIDIKDFENTYKTLKENIFNGNFKAVKLYPTYQNFSIFDERLNKVYELCEKCNIPVIIHISESKKSKYTIKPNKISKLIQKFDKLIIVIAHFGFPNIKETLNLIKTNKNQQIYADISALNHVKKKIS